MSHHASRNMNVPKYQLHQLTPASVKHTSSHRPGLRSALRMSTENPYYQGMDPYQILGVSRSADKKEIKAAFRKQVATWHPDKFPNDPEKKKEGNLRMEKINRAWYILGDEDRKRRYDTYGESGVGTSAASEERLKKMGGPGGFGGGFGGVDFSDFNGAVDIGDIGDIFESFFGGGGIGAGMRGRAAAGRTASANGPSRGDDLEMEIEIPFMTSIFGGREVVRARRMEECRTCNATGLKPGAKIKQCKVCKGQGQSVNVQRTPFGAFQTVTECSNCKGTGQEYEEYCGTCRGRGTNVETADVSVNIPVGIEDGTAFRIRNEGNAGRKGGPRGDMIAVIRVKKDPKFTRNGVEIYSDEAISYVDAILGTTIAADTVDGKVDIRIPPGTQPGQKLRIRGAGSPRVGGSLSQRGDAIITVKVSIPAKLSEQERELVGKIKALPKK